MNFKKINVLISTLVLTMSIGVISVSAATDLKDTTTNVITSQQQVSVDKAYNSFNALSTTNKSLYKDTKVIATSGIQAASVGSYPTRNGVMLVTSDSNILGYHMGHAGIIWTSTITVEAKPGGVYRYPNTWASQYTHVQGISVKSTTQAQDNSASNWCNARNAYPYNPNFFNTGTRTAFYCSQLVWAAYKDMYGINIDQNTSVLGCIVPVDLPNEPTNYILYVK